VLAGFVQTALGLANLGIARGPRFVPRSALGCEDRTGFALRFSEIANRVTGFSTPIFGVQWTPPQLDRDVARRVIVFLEDRRVLYSPYEAEVPDYCVDSALQIRQFLPDTLGAGGIADELADSLRAMRTACRKFVATIAEQDATGRLVIPSSAEIVQGMGTSWHFNQALGELRGVFGLHVGQLAVRYGIDVPEPLSSILPLDPATDE
jgi:hypothetical protein